MMLLTLLLALFIRGITSECQQRDIGFLCICNETDCDKVPKPSVSQGRVQLISTSSGNGGFSLQETTTADAQDGNSILINITGEQFQTILGFGGAFTDATGINILKLSDELQDLVLANYFGDDGIEYNVGRVPIGGSDFSLRPYSLDDFDGDDNLEKFALQEEDFQYKIPIIQRAQQYKGDKPLNLFASAWTAPLWMKDKPFWHSGTKLRKEYFQTWADYHLKFFEEYAKIGITFWGVTTGNEPYAGWTLSPVPNMGWITTDFAQYIKHNLGPTIRNSSFSDLKIMIQDDNLDMLPFIAQPLFTDDDVLQYVDGIALHWYQDQSTTPSVRELIHTDKKDTFALKTEACHFNTEPLLGSWARAELYIDNIFTDLEYGYVGWVDWNMVLNITGGPTHAGVLADAAIIISEDNSQFFKQPMFYALGIFSKFVKPESVRVGTDYTDNDIRVLAFLRTDGTKVVTIYNPASTTKSIQVHDGGLYTATIDLNPQSLNTVMYLNP